MSVNECEHLINYNLWRSAIYNLEKGAGPKELNFLKNLEILKIGGFFGVQLKG
jgi:hypothetical protein